MSDDQSRATDDPDETEGRKLYRQAADSLAQAQLSLASRTVKMKSAQTRATDDAADTAKSTAEPPVAFQSDIEKLKEAFVMLADAIRSENWADRERHIEAAYRKLGVPF